MKLLSILLLCVFAVCAKKSLVRLPRVGKISRIIGGEVANAGEFPFVAAIYKTTADGRYFCAGALIESQWVLTAAQCVIDATHFEIRLGSNQLDSIDPNRYIVETETYFYEPRFDPTVGLAHDVGLIKLRMPLKLHDFVQTVAYADATTAQIYPGRIVDVIGWGQTSDNSEIVNDLHKVDVAIVAQDECRLYYGEQLWNSMACAAGSFNEGICFGDIGGPLITPGPVNNVYHLNAISSFISGNGCESFDPTGFTRVDAYYDYIRNTTRYN